MKYLFSILLFLLVRIISYSQTDNSETIPLNKVILNVNAVVNATVQYQNEETRINENLNLQLVETVEYNIVNYNGEGRNMNLEMISNKNRMTALGKGSSISYSEGICLGEDNYTFSIDPEVSSPQAGIGRITAGKPYKIQLYIHDFYRDCNGSASGTSRYVSDWEGDAPTFETVPIKKEQFYVSTAVRGIFESPEDMELAMKGEMTALQQKLQGTFTPREDGGFFTSGKVSHSYNYKNEIGMVYNGTITISWSVQCGDLPKSDSPQITLSGCPELVVAEQAEVTAKASAEGGSYRFWAEPEEMFSIETTGATAKLMGSAPGSGKLFVEYTSDKGKTTQTSQAASCVQVESYNGGQAIPQIAFYDVDGKKKSGIITVPVTAQPSDAAELVTFEPADPSVLSAEGMGSEVTLQGIIKGKTMLQAKTKCDTNTGPTVEVEVVNCDDETIAALEKMRQAAMEVAKQHEQRLNEIINSEEFKRSTSRILKSIGNLGVKTGGLIIGTLGGVPGAEKSVEAASKIYGIGSNLLDMLKGGDFNQQAMNSAQMGIELFGKYIMQIAAGAYETIEAAKDFGDDLVGLDNSLTKLNDLLKQREEFGHFLDELNRRIDLCRIGTEQPKGQEEANNAKPPKPADPKPSTKPKPKTENPPVQEPQKQEPQTEEPTAEDEVIAEPERPTVAPRQVGLPFEPSDCGCNSSEGLVANQAGLSKLQLGLKNLGECVETFSTGPLTEYVNTLEGLKSVSQILGAAITAGPEAFKKAANETVPQIETFLTSTKSFDEAGKNFLNKMEKCPESLSIGMEVLKSGITITIDSIKTHY